ncbi:hypothetical protein, partial [Glycomyces dulcitolivorans]|uniref:hypothetical protein n=1 Tax=Glycomyces dulcitolivorans TaxID=2200759 RepID=UPI00130027EE
MTEHAAPQEDPLELPAAWAAKLLPRRGKRTGTPVELDPDAPDLLAEQFEVHADLLEQLLHMKKNRRYKESIRAFIAGEPDSRGAAAVGELLRYVGPHTIEWWTRLEFQAWQLTHGLPWAVATLAERYAIQPHGWFTPGVRPPLGHLQLTVSSWHEFQTINRDLDTGFVAEVRAVLAAASDEEYAAVVAAVADHRDHPAKRFAAALLLPGETDWVAEACAEYDQHRASGFTDRVLYHSVSDRAHLKAAKRFELEAYELDLESIAAVVDSLGAASLTILAKTLDSRWYLNTDIKKQLIKAIALLPGDAAAAHLVGRLDQPFVFDGAVESARRHPRSALRAVAAAADAATPAQ